jgi:hypothetical protein
MFKALVLVRNFESGAERLDFGDFTIERVGLKFEELRKVFSSVDVNQDDWVFEKTYAVPPPGPPGSPAGGIPNDVEDILTLFRLYKVGDIVFVKQAIIQPSGNRVVQFPYGAMNDLNSYSALRFELGPDECQPWTTFAEGLRASQSWGSEWFSVARRFFLHGGATEFNPKWDDVGRIVDYATALEAAVVPESESSSRRFRHRAAMLVCPKDADGQKVVCKLVRQVYELRSSVVHGSKLSKGQRDWLVENCVDVELRVRQVLTAAVQNVPPDEAERRTMLAALYDPTDDDRGAFALQMFHQIKTAAVRKAVAAEIIRLAGG